MGFDRWRADAALRSRVVRSARRASLSRQGEASEAKQDHGLDIELDEGRQSGDKGLAQPTKREPGEFDDKNGRYERGDTFPFEVAECQVRAIPRSETGDDEADDRGDGQCAAQPKG